MSVLVNFTTDSSFWELNPTMKIPEAFAELYNEDRTKNKRDSSQIMWAIALYVDDSEDNPYRNLRDEDRKMLISEDYLKVESFNWDLYRKQIELYQELNSSKLAKSLRTLESKIEERDKFISDTPYTLANGKDLDSIIANTQKIYDLIKNLHDEIEKGADTSATRGKRTESASERGLV